MQIAKWGNSLAVRIPAAVVEVLKLKEGDSVQIDVVGERSLELSKAPDAKAVLARLRKYRGKMPADFKFDRLKASERD